MVAVAVVVIGAAVAVVVVVIGRHHHHLGFGLPLGHQFFSRSAEASFVDTVPSSASAAESKNIAAQSNRWMIDQNTMQINKTIYLRRKIDRKYD